MRLSRTEARSVLLRAQGLDGSWKLARTSEGAAQVVQRLGYVQIDTITIIERAHHHVLWTRQQSYTPAMLDELLAARRVFEYWSHAAAYLPIEDFPFYLRHMRGFAERPRTTAWLAGNTATVQHVLDRIAGEGPLSSKDFVKPDRKRGTWWDWTPAKQALETLLITGKLMIARRRNFQRYYDLTERVLPAGIETIEPPDSDTARFVAARTLHSRGIVSAKEASWWLNAPKSVAAALDHLVESGEAIPVQVDGIEGALYASASVLATRSPRRRDTSVRLLSPFDNLVIDRDRTERFFDFHYRIECYTPAAKRIHGYFTLPILWGDRLVGRLDPKVDRKTRTFHVRNVSLEQGVAATEPLLSALAKAVVEFATFHGCTQVVFEMVTPDTARGNVRRQLQGMCKR